MTNETGGIKYPKQLAINETSSRRQIEQLTLFDDESDHSELKKSLCAFNLAHDIIFDGLSFACTELYDKRWQDSTTGEWHDIIGRKADPTETHYRLFAPEKIIKVIFAGPFENDWPEIRKKLIRLSFNPERKKLIIDKTHYIIDAPVKVTPWYEAESIDKFTNLSPRRKGKKEERQQRQRETGKAKGRIIGFSIEFFKPLFKPLFEMNAKKKTGVSYFLTPPYFQLKLNAMHREIYSQIANASTGAINDLITEANAAQNNGMINKPDKKKLIAKYKLKANMERIKMNQRIDRVTPQDVRNFFLALALKDNHKGSYVTISNLVEFVDGIWPKLVRTDRNGNKVLQPADLAEVIGRINVILKVYLSVLASQGNMDGAQLVPLEIAGNDTGDTNQLQIKCIKKRTLYSKYTKNEIEKSISRQITSVL